MSVNDVSRHDEPMDRLTRLGDVMLRAFDAAPARQEKDRCIAFVSDEHSSGIGIYGYDDDREAIGDLLLHLTAIFKANGLSLDIVGVPESPEGIDDY